MVYGPSTMDYKNNNDQLTAFLELLKTDLINSLQANGKQISGETARQIAINNNGNSLQLQLPGYLQMLETGRGPTRPDAIAGNPPMIQRIQQWCRENGIPDKAAWAIKKSIDKKGFKGTAGLITGPLGEENINSKLGPVLENIAAALMQEIAADF